jgi:hypothetical protein
MISRHSSLLRPQLLIIFLVALGLLFAGARVPDLSRPHRPKAIQRVVLENEYKSFFVHSKHVSDAVAVLPHPPVFSASIWFQAGSRLVSPLYAPQLFIPNFGRSPPCGLS